MQDNWPTLYQYRITREEKVARRSTAPPVLLPWTLLVLNIMIKDKSMNSDIAKGKWDQLTGSIKEQWGKLTDDDVKEMEGKFENFQGKMQEKYGMGKKEAKKAFDKLTG
ncbi:MAG: hypothetical protein ACI965_000751 [Paraglaciecola sp.]|jgi:uncharacterized protein YjbJ (UPF0337 family)